VPAAVTAPPANGSTVPANPPTTAPRVTHPSTTVASGTSATGGERIVDKTASAPVAGGHSGSPLPAIVTVALVAALGAGAFVLVRARRRRAA
jgi:hypothetical protein